MKLNSSSSVLVVLVVLVLVLVVLCIIESRIRTNQLRIVKTVMTMMMDRLAVCIVDVTCGAERMWIEIPTVV
jgi:hypothetical protein